MVWKWRARILLGVGLAVACSKSVKRDEDGGPSDGAGEGGESAEGGMSGSSAGGAAGTGGASAGAISVGGAIPLGGTFPGGAAGLAGSSSAGRGGGSGSAGRAGANGGGAGGRATCTGTLTGYLRDFQPDVHPDFEPHNMKPTAINFYNQIETGIVEAELGDDSKPVYAGGPAGTNTTQGPAYFPSWFIDNPGVNLGAEYTLVLTESAAGTQVFDRSPFLPINDGLDCPYQPQMPCLLGNSTSYPTHNYHYTFELHTRFIYREGSSFVFSGDDDAWIFVDGRLAVDLGGIHQRAEGRVGFEALGLVVGNEYGLDLFQAERHVTQANFRIETNLELVDCGYFVD